VVDPLPVVEPTVVGPTVPGPQTSVRLVELDEEDVSPPASSPPVTLSTQLEVPPGFRSGAGCVVVMMMRVVGAGGCTTGAAGAGVSTGAVSTGAGALGPRATGATMTGTSGNVSSGAADAGAPVIVAIAVAAATRAASAANGARRPDARERAASALICSARTDRGYPVVGRIRPRWRSC
jgi:hypothetical protein